MVNIKSEELLICFLLVVIGYIIAKIFSHNCECFNVGGQPNSQPNNCGDFLSRASSNCGDDPSGDLSQDCCNIILNPSDLNCDISTLDNTIKSNINTAQTNCNTLFPPPPPPSRRPSPPPPPPLPPLDPHYDYNLISEVPNNTCLSSPENIKEFSDSCDVIPIESGGQTITDCNACRSAVNRYFNKCNNDNMKNMYNRSLNNYCRHH